MEKGSWAKGGLAMKDKIRGALLFLFAILFVWLIAEGDLVESLSTTGWNGRSVGDLMKEALPTSLLVAIAIVGLILLANFRGLLRAVFHLASNRNRVRLENSLGSLKVFCGFLGLAVLFMLALMAILNGSEGGLFSGGMLAVVTRFGEFAFFLACLWGLFTLWRDYSEEDAKECSRRNEMLARIEQDPDWSRKRDEKRQQRQKEQEELEAKLGAMGYRSDPDHWEALRRSQESLADLTHQLRDTKTEL
jgi:hypothetical protein